MVVADREAIAVLAADRLLLLIDVVVEAKCQERDMGGSSDRLRERSGGSSGGWGKCDEGGRSDGSRERDGSGSACSRSS